MKVTITTFILSFIILSIGFSQNNCLDFDGGNDYVTMGDILDLGTSNFTIEAWIYVEGTSTMNKIINKGLTGAGTPSNAGYGLRTGLNTFDNIDFTVGHSNGTTVSAQATGITTNNWHHIAGVRNGTSILLYLNGLNVGSTTTPVVFDVDTNIPLAIGALHRGSFGSGITSEFMDGKIDDVRIWNTARSQTEIQNNMNLELNGNEPGLLAYYNFNQGIAGGSNTSVTTLLDGTSNGNNGTLFAFGLLGSNSNWVGSTVPFILGAIPTLSQWGLIIFVLLLLTMGTIALTQPSLALSNTNTKTSISISQLPFDKSLFLKMIISVSLITVAIFSIAILFFDYQLTNADMPGSLLTIPLVAYLIHLLVSNNKRGIREN